MAARTALVGQSRNDQPAVGQESWWKKQTTSLIWNASVTFRSLILLFLPLAELSRLPANAMICVDQMFNCDGEGVMVPTTSSLSFTVTCAVPDKFLTENIRNALLIPVSPAPARRPPVSKGFPSWNSAAGDTARQDTGVS